MTLSHSWVDAIHAFGTEGLHSLAHFNAEVSPDRSRLGIRRVGFSDHRASSFHHVQALPDLWQKESKGNSLDGVSAAPGPFASLTQGGEILIPCEIQQSWTWSSTLPQHGTARMTTSFKF